MSLLAPPGGTMGYTFSSAATGTWMRHGPSRFKARSRSALGSRLVERSTARTPNPSAMRMKSTRSR